jgi:hypothetical protein
MDYETWQGDSYYDQQRPEQREPNLDPERVLDDPPLTADVDAVWPFDEPLEDVLNLDTWTEYPPDEHIRDLDDPEAGWFSAVLPIT